MIYGACGQDVSRATRVRIADCAAAVATAFDVSHVDLTGDGRVRRIARARQIAMWLARRSACRSLPEIGRYFGRDHTTVLHAVRQVEALREKHPGLKRETDALLAKLSIGDQQNERG